MPWIDRGPGKLSPKATAAFWLLLCLCSTTELCCSGNVESKAGDQAAEEGEFACFRVGTRWTYSQRQMGVPSALKLEMRVTKQEGFRTYVASRTHGGVVNPERSSIIIMEVRNGFLEWLEQGEGDRLDCIARLYKLGSKPGDSWWGPIRSPTIASSEEWKATCEGVEDIVVAGRDYKNTKRVTFDPPYGDLRVTCWLSPNFGLVKMREDLGRHGYHELELLECREK